jgi:hypothetical protein
VLAVSLPLLAPDNAVSPESSPLTKTGFSWIQLSRSTGSLTPPVGSSILVWRPCRWFDAVRAKYTKELTTQQKVRFAARIGSRSLDHHPVED